MAVSHKMAALAGQHFYRGMSLSGVCGIDSGFVWGRCSSVPTAVTFLLPDADIVLSLVPHVSLVRQHIGPQALVLCCHKTWQVITGFDLAIAAELVAMIKTFAL